MISSTQVQYALREYKDAKSSQKVKSTSSISSDVDSRNQSFKRPASQEAKKNFSEILKEKMKRTLS